MQQNFVKIPKDLSLIKQKFIFGLTKRQAICFGIGLAMGIPAFFTYLNCLIERLGIVFSGGKVLTAGLWSSLDCRLIAGFS